MIHKLISERKSIRAFADRSIDDETIIHLFEAARWAPSSLNEQPWRFIVARKEDSESFEKILSCLNEMNRVWAQHSAMLMITVAKKSFSSRDVQNMYAMHDVGLAIGNLSLQATALDIFLHQMGGINKEKIRLLFEVPDEYEIVSIIAGGYEGNPENLPENLRAREMEPRTRKGLDELIFSNKFGEKSLLNKNQIRPATITAKEK